MRQAFVRALTELAATDDRIVLLTGDLGFGVLEQFADAYPDRFFNVGVAEANLMGVGAGMAARGLIPYCYSIATFASMRGYEQIRNGAAVHRLPVRIIGVGGGYSYGSLGPTHHAIEDIALMRAMPGMAIVAPYDDAQAAAAVRVLHAQPGPVYVRLAKDSRSVVELEGRFAWGEIDLVGDAGDIPLLVTYGGITASVMAAANALRQQGQAVRVCVVANPAPAPVSALRRALGNTSVAISVEDHRRDGGVGSLVAEIIAEASLPCRLIRLGVEEFIATTGSETFLHSRAGIDAMAIRRAVSTAVASAAR